MSALQLRRLLAPTTSCYRAVSNRFGPLKLIGASNRLSSTDTSSTNFSAEHFKDLEATAIAASAIHQPRRFYKSVEVVSVSNENSKENVSALAGEQAKVLYEVHLDTKKLKTQAGKVLKLESNLLALAIAQEWDAQKEQIHKSRMLLTGLAFTSIDNPFNETSESLCSKMLDFMETDTLLYFTHESEAGSLARLQHKEWIPIIEWANEKFGLDLKASHFINEPPHVSEESKQIVRKWMESHSFAGLNALNYGADAVKSILIMLATVEHHLNIDEAVKLARLEQIHQIKTWGNVEWSHDIEHQQLCTRLSAAVLFAHLCGSSSNVEPMLAKVEKKETSA